MTFFDPQNPGIGGLDELTESETLTIQNISGLGDPGADRILFWDDSVGAYAFLTVGSGLIITGTTITTTASGSGTVTDVSVVTINGISGSVANSTTTPAITLTLGEITPTSVNGLTLTSQAIGFTIAGGTTSKTLTVPLDASVSGTNTGDNATNSQYSGLAASKADIGQTFYIGTTQVAINRSSAALTLAGITLTTPNIGTPSDGTLTNCTGLPIAGLVASTSTALGVGSIELGHASDTTLTRVSAGVIAVEGVTVPTISSTSTLTNKRITKRVGTTTSSATPTINTDNYDMYTLTAQAVDITSFTTNLSGTPTDGQTLWIAITGTAARAITWGSSFESSTQTLPTTTVTTNRLDVGFVWNAVTSKWRCVAIA